MQAILNLDKDQVGYSELEIAVKPSNEDDVLK